MSAAVESMAVSICRDLDPHRITDFYFGGPHFCDCWTGFIDGERINIALDLKSAWWAGELALCWYEGRNCRTFPIDVSGFVRLEAAS